MTDRIFDHAVYAKARRPFGLWTRFLLLFRPLHKSMDITPEITVEFWFKELFGVTYFVDVRYSGTIKPNERGS